MILQCISRERMCEDDELAAMHDQPWQNTIQKIGPVGQLAAPVGVRPDRPLVHAAHLYAEFLRSRLAQSARKGQRIGIEVNMGGSPG